MRTQEWTGLQNPGFFFNPNLSGPGFSLAGLAVCEAPRSTPFSWPPSVWDDGAEAGRSSSDFWFQVTLEQRIFGKSKEGSWFLLEVVSVSALWS